MHEARFSPSISHGDTFPRCHFTQILSESSDGIGLVGKDLLAIWELYLSAEECYTTLQGDEKLDLFLCFSFYVKVGFIFLKI